MTRKVRSPKMESRSAREPLRVQKAPYWTRLSKGGYLGYYKGPRGGSWLVRMRGDDGKQYQRPLGVADDRIDADGLAVFSFDQAQEAARAFFALKARELAGHIEPHRGGRYTVKDALDDYFTARERRGSKAVRRDRYSADARIAPALGGIELSKLTTKMIRDWHTGLATAPRLVRAKKLAKKPATRPVDLKDPEVVRQRRATANRRLSVLKAALNFAYHEGRVASDEAWRKVKPFREVDAPVIRFLTAAECVRLVNACAPDFRAIVRGALVTGCRYGELARMRAGDFNADAGTVTVRISKSGKPRHVALNDEGQRLFAALTTGRAPNDLIFLRDDGNAWAASHQQRPLEAACKRAKIEPAATFHILRHTYASALAMRGVPMGVIAAQLGHADTRMTEKHYAHLAPNYVAETVRAALPGFGIIDESNVVAIIGGPRLQTESGRSAPRRGNR